MTSPSTVPWLEPNGRRKNPRGRGDGGLSRHLYLHALQRPGFHGMVPSRSPGAKGTPAIVTVHLNDPKIEKQLWCIQEATHQFLLTCFGGFTPGVGPSQILSGSWRGVQAGGRERAGHPMWGGGRPLSQHHMEEGKTPSTLYTPPAYCMCII